MARKRVAVVANKWWECDPLVSVLLSDAARPAANLGWPEGELVHRRPATSPSKPGDAKPRATFALRASSVEVWCVSDLMEHLPSDLQSSTEAKASVVGKIADAGNPLDLVIAFGTAAYPRSESENGSVVTGTRVFMHDGREDVRDRAALKQAGPPSKWTAPFDQVIESSVDDDFFNFVTSIETFPESVLNRFIIEPIAPVSYGTLFARRDLVALGTVNVTNAAQYKAIDPKTIEAFCARESLSLAGSIETTHGLLRQVLGCERFMFVSGISNRIGHFDEEVLPRMYAQNIVAAHNAAIAVAWMLPRIDERIGLKARRSRGPRRQGSA